jgi:hypothetical protein
MTLSARKFLVIFLKAPNNTTNAKLSYFTLVELVMLTVSRSISGFVLVWEKDSEGGGK